MRPRILTVLGTRPQLIKALPMSAALGRAGIEEFVVDTGQHYDHAMAEGLRLDLGLRSPDRNLALGSGSHAEQTAAALEAIAALIVDQRPELVLVFGDTNSTLAGALAAAKLHVPVAHVEAGLRSFNRRMPEETNRVVADHLSTLLFAPTRTAVDNLAREGMTQGVHLTGDVMFDAIRELRERIDSRWPDLAALGLRDGEYILATVHRQENTDDAERWGRVLDCLAQVAERVAPVVWPVHPRTRTLLVGARLPGVRLIDPLPYTSLQAAVAHARAVVTDSGGLQKEAAFHRTPCITLRDETEWTELVAAGVNVLVGTDAGQLLRAIQDAPDRTPPLDPTWFGEGDASGAIAAIITSHLSTGHGRPRVVVTGPTGA